MLSLKAKNNKNIQFKGEEKRPAALLSGKFFKIISDVMFGAEAWSEGGIEKNGQSLRGEKLILLKVECDCCKFGYKFHISSWEKAVFCNDKDE